MLVTDSQLLTEEISCTWQPSNKTETKTLTLNFSQKTCTTCLKTFPFCLFVLCPAYDVLKRNTLSPTTNEGKRHTTNHVLKRAVYLSLTLIPRDFSRSFPKF